MNVPLLQVWKSVSAFDKFVTRILYLIYGPPCVTVSTDRNRRYPKILQRTLIQCAFSLLIYLRWTGIFRTRNVDITVGISGYSWWVYVGKSMFLCICVTGILAPWNYGIRQCNGKSIELLQRQKNPFLETTRPVRSRPEHAPGQDMLRYRLSETGRYGPGRIDPKLHIPVGSENVPLDKMQFLDNRYRGP